MIRIGLTGGIACGKSYTLRKFRSLGVQTIDADQLARQVVEPGKPAYQEIVREFGPEILSNDGAINRKKLADLIFRDETSRQKLNAIVHPHIFEAEAEQIARIENREDRNSSPLVMVDAALMIETGSYRNYRLLIVVYSHPSVQLRRLMARDQVSREEALLRIDSQMPLLKKVQYADYLIDNSGKLAETDRQIKQTYLELLKRFEQGEL